MASKIGNATDHLHYHFLSKLNLSEREKEGIIKKVNSRCLYNETLFKERIDDEKKKLGEHVFVKNSFYDRAISIVGLNSGHILLLDFTHHLDQTDDNEPLVL